MTRTALINTGIKKEQGMTLIELMIASLLSILIVTALSQLFVDLSRGNQELANTNTQIENARFAMQFIENDIIHAGYWGGHVPEWDDISNDNVPTDTPIVTPNPCTDYSSWTSSHVNGLIGIPLAVYGTAPSGCSTQITNHLAGTDILVVRHVSTCVAGSGGCEAYDSNKLYLNVSNCITEIDAGDLITLDPNSPATLHERDCTTAAANRKFQQTIYYIRDYADTIGDGTPTLVRSEFDWNGSALLQGKPIPLIAGIEDMRVEVGIDNANAAGSAVNYASAISWISSINRVFPQNRGNGIPDGNQYYHCPTTSPAGATPCTSAHFQDIVAAKIYLLSRAPNESAGYRDVKTYLLGGKNIASKNDRFKRHVYSRTIRLHNVSGRRETPYDPNDPSNPLT